MLLIPSLKHITKKQKIEYFPDSADFYLPLQSYNGSYMELIVNVADSVKKYQLIAKSTTAFRASIHAPVSGTILGIVEIDGKQYIHLKNDFKYTETLLEPVELKTLSVSTFIRMLLEKGIEGEGGARFPAYKKYKAYEEQIDTLILNGAECEPYLSSDYAVMKYFAKELMAVLKTIQSLWKIKRIVFGIEKHNKELKPLLTKEALEIDLKIEIKLLPNQYPQGGKLQLIKSVTGLELAKGTIPSQHGILVHNVSTLYAIHQSLAKGLPRIERVITISGNSKHKIGNYLIKIGTPVDHILKTIQHQWDPELQTIVLGGAMMGKAIQSPLTPIHKGVGGLLILNSPKKNADNCIECGYCVDVCPQKLMPLEFVRNTINQQWKKLNDFHLNDCIECGACAYTCPSDVPLMNSIFEGKMYLKNAESI